MSIERCGNCSHPKENHIAGNGKCYAETPLPDKPGEFEVCTVCDKFESEVTCCICGGTETEHLLTGKRRRMSDLSNPEQLTFREHIFKPGSTK
jgi:hypothetical protein